jgi:glycine cleavage system aminomethyltransferase T
MSREEFAAVRSSVAVSDGDQLVCVRVAGANAHELLDRVSPRQLFVRSGQMLHTLLLDDAALPLADIYICCDEDDYLVIAEGMAGLALAGYLGSHAHGLDVTIEDQSQSHGFLCVDGPYAWELIADVTSPDIIGVPYLGFFREDKLLCFRAGKTGEYGYDLLVPRERLAAVRDQLLSVGIRLDARAVSREVLDQCALEAGFFNVRRHVRAGLTPVELQLQWRVTAGRTYPGSDALAKHRASPRGRVAMIAAATQGRELPIDAAVTLAGERVGTVLDGGWSFARDEAIGVAMLDLAVSHAGLRGFACGDIALRTISAPAINNRSLYVDPQRHTFATRANVDFPPLVRPVWE